MEEEENNVLKLIGEQIKCNTFPSAVKQDLRWFLRETAYINGFEVPL
jgi:hypothetical protein